MPTPRDRYFALGATVVVAGVIALAFYKSGSPRVQRSMSIDYIRVDRLRAISQAIRNRPTLPPDLNSIKGFEARIGDPETDAVFEYRPKDATHYDLCANFAMESEDWMQKPNSRSSWAHPAGRYCYALDSKDILAY